MQRRTILPAEDPLDLQANFNLTPGKVYNLQSQGPGELRINESPAEALDRVEAPYAVIAERENWQIKVVAPDLIRVWTNTRPVDIAIFEAVTQ